MNRMFLVLTATVLVLAVGCDKLGGEPDLYPTTVGSTWRHVSAVTRTELDGDTLRTSISRSEVVGKATLAVGEAAAVASLDSIRIYDTTYVYADTFWVLKKDNRVLVLHRADDTSPDTMLVLPLETGKTWLVSAEGGGETRAKVIGKQDVTVLAGTFKDCWLVELAFTDAGPDTMRTQLFMADNVGLVRRYYERMDESHVRKYEEQLADHNIK